MSAPVLSFIKGVVKKIKGEACRPFYRFFAKSFLITISIGFQSYTTQTSIRIISIQINGS